MNQGSEEETIFEQQEEAPKVGEAGVPWGRVLPIPSALGRKSG